MNRPGLFLFLVVQLEDLIQHRVILAATIERVADCVRVNCYALLSEAFNNCFPIVFWKVDQKFVPEFFVDFHSIIIVKRCEVLLVSVRQC